MTARIKMQIDRLLKREYRELRSDKKVEVADLLQGKSYIMRSALRFREMLRAESPRLFDDDHMGFYRTIKEIPSYRDADDGLCMWSPGNVTPNYGAIIGNGFCKVLADIAKVRAQVCERDAEKLEFLEAAKICMEEVLVLAERYKRAADESGNTALYTALCKIPYHGADSFYEACVFLKILIFSMRLNDDRHITLGRFDQYMYPYYLKDRNKGVTDNKLLECLEELFISLNMDTDLYPGVQQGDNGQSMVLGGCDKDGNNAYQELSGLCIEASLELSVIDPKINLRVSKKTPLSMYELGTKLTKQGLGFPQYDNDDIVIPGLEKLGYSLEDARDYSVAACWEFIISNKGMDIPNICSMNFPLVVNRTIANSLLNCESFSQLLEAVKADIKNEVNELVVSSNQIVLMPSPYLSVFIDGCLEKAADCSRGAAKYNNSGCHGVGIANGADALAAVKVLVFDEKSLEPKTMLTALEADFKDFEELRHRLLACPKMGNNDAAVDDLAKELMNTFADCMNGQKNNRGGIFRAGTGSAMEYIRCAEKVPATADGRHAFENFSANFSPALTTKLNGPLSVISSFTKFDLQKTINGGPLTLEIHDTTFRNDQGIQKVAQLVKAFIDLGGHQLQLNAINRDRLLEAQKHPEKYPNLIVRVWGWSGYFNELDLEYQNHIISRSEFAM